MTDKEIKESILTLAYSLEKSKPNESKIAEIKSLIDRMQNINWVEKKNWDNNLLKDLISVCYSNVSVKELIRYVVENGADVNYEIEGFNCLITTWFDGDYEIMKLLLDAGANLFERRHPTV